MQVVVVEFQEEYEDAEWFIYRDVFTTHKAAIAAGNQWVAEATTMRRMCLYIVYPVREA